MTSKTALDFIIIGAQKSGTTSLFEYLRGHPRIALPAAKEAPFFDKPAAEDRARVAAFLADLFHGADPARLWGKASPQYMTAPEIPARLARAMPGLRLIAILRDPVERAISHYRMVVRRGHETRPIDQALREEMTEEALRRSRALGPAAANEPHGYVAWGEYGRILSAYRDHFDALNMLALFVEDMERDPGATLDRVLTFLGLDPGFRPVNLGRRYQPAGGAGRLGRAKPILRSLGVLTLWHALPLRVRLAVLRRIDMVRVGREPELARHDPAPETRARLADHFREDIALLERLIGAQAPWAGASTHHIVSPQQPVAAL